jgi:hypothetical protein
MKLWNKLRNGAVSDMRAPLGQRISVKPRMSAVLEVSVAIVCSA